MAHQTVGPPPAAKAPKWQLSDEIHRNFTTWSLVPPAQIRLILSAVEPVALSDRNLGSTKVRGMREVPRLPMVQLIEYVFDKKAQDPVGTERRVSAIIEEFKSLNEENGRPAQYLVFPLDFGKYGRYRKAQRPSDGATIIYAYPSGQFVDITDRFGDFADLVINDGHSVATANITNRIMPSQKPHPCCMLFAKGDHRKLVLVQKADGCHVDWAAPTTAVEPSDTLFRGAAVDAETTSEDQAVAPEVTPQKRKSSDPLVKQEPGDDKEKSDSSGIRTRMTAKRSCSAPVTEKDITPPPPPKKRATGKA